MPRRKKKPKSPERIKQEAELRQLYARLLPVLGAAEMARRVGTTRHPILAFVAGEEVREATYCLLWVRAKRLESPGIARSEAAPELEVGTRTGTR